jgi:hypothetical protein
MTRRMLGVSSRLLAERRSESRIGRHVVVPSPQCRLSHSEIRRRARDGALTLWSLAVAGALAFVAPRPACAQQDSGTVRLDSAHVSYRTEDIVFVTAGREAGLAVGDTLELLGSDGSVIARGVVMSVAQKTASATLMSSGTRVAVGQLVRFTRHPPPVQVAAAPPPAADTAVAAGVGAPEVAAAAAPAPAADTVAPSPVLVPRRAVNARWRGSLQLDQSASSAGRARAGAPALTTYQTSAGLALSGPLAPWLSFSARTTSRFRSASTGLATLGLTGNSTILYQLEARVAPPGSWWNLSLGRFLPADAPGLGYLDGGRLEVQPAAGQRIGVLAGYAPDVFTMKPSSQVARAGAYWGFTGGKLSGSLSGATEWQWSAIRRTWFSGQGFWSPAPGTSFSLLADVDHGAGWEKFRGLRLTNLSAGARTNLPLGFRAGVTFQSQQALQLFSMAVLGDTFPLPGRLTSWTASLGHDLLGSSVELSAGYLKRTTDPNPTYRGTLTLFSRHFMLAAMAQHSDLFDFGSLVARLPIPLGNTPLTAALGFSSNVVRTPGGVQTLWRYGVEPELGFRLGGGFYASVSGDIGKYAGQTSTYLRAGVSYQLW